MSRARGNRDDYEWMLGLSAEGWAWEFLRRNLDYRRDYTGNLHAESGKSSRNAGRWGLLQFVDPDLDARSAVVFWNPEKNISVLTLVTAGQLVSNGLSGIKCEIAILKFSNPDVQHVLFSCDGRFLQLAVTGQGTLETTRYLIDALPEHGKDRKFMALRRLADLAQYKRLRPHLYAGQRRAPRLMHLVRVLDSHARNPAHRSIAQEIFGIEKTIRDWDNLRDHVRRAVAAGRKLTQGGYLDWMS